ncbi:MAG: hypothetical protein ACOY93_05020 [Bacillota bacterium]
MTLLLCAGFLLIILIEVPPLILRGQTAVLRAFWAVLGISFLVCLAVVNRWPIPNPSYFLEVVFRPLATALGLG